MSVPAAFNGAGTAAGVEIWRIEKLEPAKWPKESYGSFYSGDCYIILHSKPRGSGLEWDLYFWLGRDSSQDEQGAAALMTVALDESLGGGPVQFREVQGHESPAFLGVFPSGVRFMDGGIESGFNHVEPESYEPKLFHVKGKRKALARQVELKSSAMNAGDCFVLDKGATVYQWNGPEANGYEKAAALRLAESIKAERTETNVNIVVLDAPDDDDAEFWGTVGPKDAVQTAEAGGADRVEAKQATGTPELYKISDESGSMEVTKVGEGKFQRDALDHNDAFLLDGGGAVVFVWVGKKANKNERKKAMAWGVEYAQSKGYGPDVPIRRVNDSGETPAFKAFFQSPWDPPKQITAETKEEAKIDASAMLASRKSPQDDVKIDVSGEVEVWRIEDGARVALPEEQFGQFFMGDSYIVLYTYFKGTKKAWIIYFWQGRDSSTDEKAQSALLAKELDDSLGGDPVQVRVVMGKEPDHFLALFNKDNRKMIVHSGGRASAFKNRQDTDSYDTDGISLYHVNGQTALNTRAVQVEEKASSLNSGDCFVLLTPGTMYVWMGNLANDEEKATASAIAEKLAAGRAVENVTEGAEPAGFWEALGGEGEYPKVKSVDGVAYEPRLFQCSTNRGGAGSWSVEEIFQFSQDDLCQDDVMLLDTGAEVWIWVGNNSSKQESDNAIKTALDYVKAKGDEDTPIYRVGAGTEPPSFTCHFRGWNEEHALDFTDPYAAKMAKMGLSAGPGAGGASEQKAAAPQRVTADDIGFKKGVTFPIAELQAGVPAGCDPAHKEQYLSDADFQTAFNMDKAAFGKLAGWKQAAAKKKVGLF